MSRKIKTLFVYPHENLSDTNLPFFINKWLIIIVMSILVMVANVIAAPMITDNNSEMYSAIETMDLFAYEDSNNIVHITTDYYVANSTSIGTFDFTGLDGTILAVNSSSFEAGYGEDSEKLILNSSFEIDLNGDNKPDGWTFKLDLFGKLLSMLNINIWKMSTNKAIDGKHSLELNDNIGFLRKEAYSDAIPVSQGKKYRINVSIYVEHVEYIRPAIGNGIYAVWLDEKGNLVSREGMKIYETTKRWINISYYVENIPNRAKYMKILLRQSRSAKGKAYFDNVRVTELIETSNITRASKPVNPVLTVNQDIAMVSYSHSLPNRDVTINYTFYKTKSYVDYVAKMHYKKDTMVPFERIIFDIKTNNGTVLLKDYRTVHIAKKKIASGQWTPKIVEFRYPPTENIFSFIGGDNMQSMVLQPKNNSFSELILYFDDERNHPFHYYKDYHKIFNLDETKRVAGETISYYVTFSVNNSEKYIAKMRQPYGSLATLIFTEHPDGENVKKSRATAYGYSDISDPAYGTKGILGNNLTWTKGIFVYDFVDHPTDALMEKPEYKALIDQMYLDGVEIVPHTMTWNTDNRTIVSSGLDVLDQYNACNWIDHGLRKNFETLGAQGWNIQSEYYIMDMLHDHNYKYAWGAIDYPITESLNILEPDETSVINPFMYYNNRVDDNLTDTYKIFLWNTINTEKRPDEYYTKANVDRLINEKGIHIGHEYFDWEGCEGHAYDKLLFKDEYKINDLFENELEYIAKKKSEGSLWVPTVSEFGDYLRSISNVRIIYDGNNEYTIKNDNNHAVNGLAFITDKTNINKVLINDTISSNFKVVGKDIIFWMDIGANSEKKIRFE